jgi:hypothetical protein
MTKKLIAGVPDLSALRGDGACWESEPVRWGDSPPARQQDQGGGTTTAPFDPVEPPKEARALRVKFRTGPERTHPWLLRKAVEMLPGRAGGRLARSAAKATSRSNMPASPFGARTRVPPRSDAPRPVLSLDARPRSSTRPRPGIPTPAQL